MKCTCGLPDNEPCAEHGSKTQPTLCACGERARFAACERGKAPRAVCAACGDKLPIGTHLARLAPPRARAKAPRMPGGALH